MLESKDLGGKCADLNALGRRVKRTKRAARRIRVRLRLRSRTPKKAIITIYSAFLNPAAFAQPSSGTYGNMATNSMLPPGFIQIDMGLVRALPIREGKDLQFRAEAFNLSNHVNPDVCLSGFGVIDRARLCRPR